MIVISRALLHFERIERPPGPIDDRMRAAMSLMARTRAPFEDPGLHVVWQDRHAAVWSWDQARLTDLGAQESAWFMPEPALGGSRKIANAGTADDGFVLMERRDGYEGQIRQNGELAASRFWTRRPDEAETARFRRATHASTAPDTAEADNGPRPLNERIRDITSRIQPVHAAVLVLLLIGTPLLHAAGSQLRLSMEQATARNALAAFTENSAGDFGALDSYRAHSAQLAIYREALERINPLAPAAEIAEAAGALDTRITQLRIEPDRVRALIDASGSLDPAALAQALELQPTLVNVRLNRTANSAAWEAQADLTAPEAPEAPAEDTEETQ
ncbi:MAG: hypothetical protein DHS20C06_02900 [Hyphobacterium sp.]|nr:MAG: hypothetical protein DHS20C06_02900 [Hyphobacterium sp.]